VSNGPPNSHGHPTLQELELAREGSLNARQNAEIVRHLSNCEACQAAIQQYEDTFHSLREYRREQANWSNFGSRLDAADRQEAAKRTATLLTRTGRIPRLAWCTAAASLALAFLVFYDFGQIRRASASELLARAVRQEATGPVRTARRIQIKSRSRRTTLVREISDTTSRVSGSENQTADQLSTLFDRHHLSWATPLSARSFESWRNSLATKTDSVSSTESTWSVTTSTTEDDLHSATLVISKADYHPIEQHLEFSDDSIEIAELPTSPPPPAMATSAVVPRFGKSMATGPALPKPAVLETSADLDHAEVLIRVALHELKADIDEQLSVERTADGVNVGGVVENAERLRQITNRLGAIPGTHLAVNSADKVDTTLSEPAEVLVSSGGTLRPALLQTWLEEKFPQDHQREEFVGHVLMLAREVSQHASALRQFAERYSEARWQKLSAADAGALVEVIRDLRTSDYALGAQLAQDLKDVVPVLYELPAEPSLAYWRCETESHVNGATRVNQSLFLLFTRTDNDGIQAPAALHELQEGLETLSQAGCSSSASHHQ